MSTRKDINHLLQRVARQGFTIVWHHGSSHRRVAAPDGRWVTVPGTPSNPRSVQTVRAKLRSIGAEL